MFQLWKSPDTRILTNRESSILLEVCVDSSEGLGEAINGGADRIELCSALELGGLTPSIGLISSARNSPIPVYVMVRPRSGDFMYNELEIVAMEQDIETIGRQGLAGVVFGANRHDGSLDSEVLKRLMNKAHEYKLGATLHRSFDLVPELGEAVKVAIKLGFERILTSGRSKQVFPDGCVDLTATIKMAGKRISIMPGSGINAENVFQLIQRFSEISEVHSSCSITADFNGHDKLLEFGFVGKTIKKTSGELVLRMKQQIQRPQLDALKTEFAHLMKGKEKETEEQQRDEVEFKMLCEAAQTGDVSQVRRLLQMGVNKDWLKENKNDLIHTVLCSDSIVSLAVLKLLIENGVPVNAKRNFTGTTPLHIAAMRGLNEACKMLIHYGADVNAENNTASRPLFDATFIKNQPATVCFLLQNGAKVDAVNIYGETVLHWAARQSWTEAAKVMLEHADKMGPEVKKTLLDTQDEEGNTALHYASKRNYVDFVKMLVQHGASQNVKNKAGEKPVKL